MAIVTGTRSREPEATLILLAASAINHPLNLPTRPLMFPVPFGTHLPYADADEWFNESLQKYRAGTLPAYQILDLGRMPFHSIQGWLSKVPVLMPQNMLRKAKEKHLLDLDGFQDLPSRVQMPAAIFDSKDQPGRFIIVTDLIADEGPIVVVIAPAQNRDAGTHWVVVSVHARDAAQLRRWEEQGLLRFMEPAKCRSWKKE